MSTNAVGYQRGIIKHDLYMSTQRLLQLLKLSIKFKSKDFLLISTDKAVLPTNVMGATKRIAELITLGYNKKNSLLKTTVVRFGNVMNSTGSVIPLFDEQIKNGGPVTLTDKDVSRYFISLRHDFAYIAPA